MIISRTPLRLSFFGGGTDYREYYHRSDGAVLGTTINKYVYVSINRLSDFFEYKIRVSYSKAELVNKVEEIIHPSVRECLKFNKINGNLDIHIFADLPARTGLGSSSAFTVGFLNALQALQGKIIPNDQLAQNACIVEQEMIKENVGSQDQYHSAYGGMNILEFNKNGIRIRPLIISQEKRKLWEESILLFFTKQTRYASQILSEQVANTKNGNKDLYLQKMKEMVHKAENIFSNDPPQTMVKNLGVLLNEGWELKKNLSTQITNPVIDELYKRALNAGAYGGKLAGAGGGGFLTIVASPQYQASVRESLKDLLEVKFKFEDEGSKIIYLN